MSRNSRDVVYIPTCFPEERARVGKSKEELAKLPASLTDVWRHNLVQKYDARRGLDDVCLAEFASKYTGRSAAPAATVTTSGIDLSQFAAAATTLPKTQTCTRANKSCCTCCFAARQSTS
ncbi:hypothetical protein MRX96_021828 [Rhipicephalus microplus]